MSETWLEKIINKSPELRQVHIKITRIQADLLLIELLDEQGEPLHFRECPLQVGSSARVIVDWPEADGAQRLPPLNGSGAA